MSFRARATQPAHAGPKLAAHGVVRIIVKTHILPERIHVRRHIPILAAAPPEFGDMLIADFKLGQSLGELRGIVLGIGSRSRNGPNIDDNLDLLRPQQVRELTDGAGRVSNCKESIRRVPNLPSDYRAPPRRAAALARASSRII